MKLIDPEKYCTTREAAKLLGVSLRTAQLWSESGLLEAWKTGGGHRRISMASVRRVLEQKSLAAEEPHADVDALKVLVVEDDNLLLKAYKVRMNSWGMPIKVVTAPNAYEALILIGRESPDLMISDLMMPGIDGFQMIRTVVNSPFKEGMEIVVVSGLQPAEIESRGGVPQGIPVYPKPIPFEALRAYCQNLIDRRKAVLETI